MANFQPARAKLTIGSLDDPSLTVKAHYNPRELQISKQIPWTLKNEADRKVTSGKEKSASKQDSVESTGAPARTMTLELLFDGYETGKSIAPEIDLLDQLSSPMEPAAKAKDEPKRRAHYCVVVWGQRGIPPMRCVIEQLAVKYTMFDSDGMPLRATATVTVKEANIQLETAGAAVNTVFTKSIEESPRNIAMSKPTGSSTTTGSSTSKPPATTPRSIGPTPPPPAGRSFAPPPPPPVAKPAPAVKPFGPAVPKPPSAAGRAEAMKMFEEVNAPKPPSAAGSKEAMEMFEEVNGPAGAPKKVDPKLLDELE